MNKMFALGNLIANYLVGDGVLILFEHIIDEQDNYDSAF
jgi:hypothetical protein